MRESDSNLNFNFDDMVGRLTAAYYRATAEELRDGIDWYVQAHQWCAGIAARYGLTLEVAVAITAAMSQGQSWDNNRMAVVSLLEGTGKCPAYKDVLSKVKNILETGDVSLLTGPKITAFYQNILDPWRSEAITVDRWMARLAVEGWEGKLTVTPSRYNRIAPAIAEAARMVGLSAFQFQAVVWLVARREAGFQN